MSYPAGFLDELRNRIRLSDLVGRRVALKRRGREFIGLCPFHSEKTPSFSVVDTKGFFHCFGCAAHGDAIGFVMHADGLDFVTAVAQLAGEVGLALPETANRARPDPPSAPPPAVSDAPRDAADRQKHKIADARRRARAIWEHAQCDLCGTLAEVYFASRDLSLQLASELRFAPACEHPWTRTRPPALLARISGWTGEIIGLHRTYLRSDGLDKAPIEPPRTVLGTRDGGAVRLAAVQPDNWLIVGEGIETTLSTMQACDMPGWAALCAGGIEALQLPDEARAVTIIADNDASGAGQRAAWRAAQRWRAEGRRVRIAIPKEPGTDANDLLRRRGL